jgi:hypothetical protein
MLLFWFFLAGIPRTGEALIQASRRTENVMSDYNSALSTLLSGSPRILSGI